MSVPNSGLPVGATPWLIRQGHGCHTCNEAEGPIDGIDNPEIMFLISCTHVHAKLFPVDAVAWECLSDHSAQRLLHMSIDLRDRTLIILIHNTYRFSTFRPRHYRHPPELRFSAPKGLARDMAGGIGESMGQIDVP